MLAIINIVILILLLLLLVQTKVLRVDNERFVSQKMKLFLIILIAQIIIEIFASYFDECDLKFRRVWNRSLKTALLSVVGYSLFVDLQYQKKTRHYFHQMKKGRGTHLLWVIGSSILLVWTYQVLELMFGGADRCPKEELEKRPPLRRDQW